MSAPSRLGKIRNVVQSPGKAVADGDSGVINGVMSAVLASVVSPRRDTRRQSRPVVSNFRAVVALCRRGVFQPLPVHPSIVTFAGKNDDDDGDRERRSPTIYRLAVCSVVTTKAKLRPSFDYQRRRRWDSSAAARRFRQTGEFSTVFS